MSARVLARPGVHGDAVLASEKPTRIKMEAARNTKVFAFFYVRPADRGIRYRAILCGWVRLFSWPGIVSVSCIHRLQSNQSSLSFPSFLCPFSRPSHHHRPPSTVPLLLLSLLLPHFPRSHFHSISQPFSHKNISTPSWIFFLSVAIPCTLFQRWPSPSPSAHPWPLLFSTARSGAKCDLNARKSGR